MKLNNALELERCPHCNVHYPNLISVHYFESFDHSGGNHRYWRAYTCKTCGGVIIAAARESRIQIVTEYFPKSRGVDPAIPDRAKAFLSQAIESANAPAGAVMLSASAVDAMLKAKGLIDGNLYSRIDAAAEQHLITGEMAAWAHEVRLDANDQRHADLAAALPSLADAEKCIAFAQALGEFLFVLPARVERGRKS